MILRSCPIEEVKNGATLQTDPHKLLDWSNTWQMQFNIEKCKVMHFGYNNPCLEYTMEGAKLTMTESEKDLGVMIHSGCDLPRFPEVFRLCALPTPNT